MNSPDPLPEHEGHETPDPEATGNGPQGRNAFLLQEPRRLHGARTPCVSPLAFYGLTHEERPVPNAAERHLFLTERDIERVDARGVVVGGEWYTSPKLAPYLTRSAAEPSPDLIVLRDEALFSRGILREAFLYEVEPGDTRRFICKLEYRGGRSDGVDSERVWRYGHEYERQLKMDRDDFEEEFAALALGKEEAKKLHAAQAARRRRNARERPDPRPAEPMEGKSGEEEAMEDLLRRLQQEQQAGREEEQPSAKQRGEAERRSIQKKLRKQRLARKEDEETP
jgi:hypothetical protein